VGDGTIQRRNTPVSVPFPGALAGKPVLQVVGGERSSLALFHDGTMATWGSGVAGGTSPVAFDPGPNLAGKIPVAVAMGFGHSLALCEDGTLGAWGSNTYGQLGDGTTTERAKPVVINNMGALAGRKVVAIAAGGYHNLALCGDGTLVTWGNNASGQLGNGTTGATPATVPVLVNQTVALAGQRVIGIAAGGYHCLALGDDGAVYAWGSGEDGRLGNGGEASVSSPVAVALSGVLTGGPVTAITAGMHHSMALRGDGTVFAWGRNSDGQLGNGSTNRSLTPVSVRRTGLLAGRTVTAISAGEAFSLATCSDGTIAAWGSSLATATPPPVRFR
jgi:alpha-tubulin suppressor-like RCC1 family protein